MREIKFRGKRVDNGEWVYGSLLISEHQEKNLEPLHYFICPLDKGYHRVIPDTVGQFTGLHDKNGKETYEGDIVKHHDDILSVVIYNSVHCAYVMTDITGNRNRCQCDKLGSYSSLWIEVVGSIYENPDLLSAEGLK